MKNLVMLLTVMSLAGVVSANCGNGNGNGNGCNGNTGPQGPQGPQGPTGNNGTNGSNGTNGANGTNGTDGADGSDGTSGKDGKDGKNGRDASTRVMPVVDLAVRIYDGKYIQLQAFNVWKLADRNKLAGAGTTEFMAGARIVIKVGRSYEERRIDELEKKLKLLGVR